MKTRQRTLLLNLAAVLTAGVFLPQTSRAVDYTWVPTTGGTWDTTTANWNDGVTNPTAWVNGTGNAAKFDAFSAGATVVLGTNIVTGSLASNGGSTIVFNGAGTLDVANINTATAGSLDMSAKITGSHGLTINSSATVANNAGRLNLKVAADYTGDTFLTGTAYLLLDGVSNALPTGTTLNMVSGTTFRFAKAGLTQQIAGLQGAGTIQSTSPSTGNVLTIVTKSGVTTAYSGTISSTAGLSLVISGSGTQTLSGGNLIFNGSTTVSSGTLLLGGNLRDTSSVSVTGGNLRSSANVNLGQGAVTMSAGTIDARGTGVAGSFTLAANQNFTTTGGSIKIDLDTTALLDQIIGSGTGTFSLTNTALDLNLITWSASDYNNSYTIFSGFSNGSLTNVSITGYDTANYIASLSNGGVLSFAAVPEPSMVALLGLSGVALALYRIRRRSRSV